LKALITGITGQDGSYLAELLIEKGYEVYGLVPSGNWEKCERIKHLIHQIKLVAGDLTDQASLDHMIEQLHPDEIYNWLHKVLFRKRGTIPRLWLM
jgi:GDPmannose 4,6-dehydratase